MLSGWKGSLERGRGRLRVRNENERAHHTGMPVSFVSGGEWVVGIAFNGMNRDV